MLKKDEILHVWQPVTSLVGRNPAEMQFVDIQRHNDYLKIVFQDFHDNQVEIIYDQLYNSSTPTEYVVWAFRYSTEYGRPDLHTIESDFSGLVDSHSPYFFKVSNSKFIEWFDRNPLINSKLYPNLEHHLFISGDEVFEVLSAYEPRFVEKKIDKTFEK
ncbi:hypothetical protein [Bacillus sp. PS06]|uniref:hypothetical protein n=1 Tax=Bacillus sp. PS06 TaxID=2764176 RepID=UPI00177E8945|nr:hypothetical protein [Bacillus sp. PS06]MBD8070034.1 hypothetical protein [Bacillus sp. PS06]